MFNYSNILAEMKAKAKILIVDSEYEDVEAISKAFLQEKYDVFISKNSKEALLMSNEESPDLIILELLMPEMDGVELCYELKKNKKLSKTLIVFYTKRDDDYSQIAAFNAGADDYIIKPAKPRVLISRINALLRRGIQKTELKQLASTRNLVVDRERYLIYKDGEEIILPRKEFELLDLLLASPKKVFTRKEISETIWGYEIFSSNRTIDVHIRKIREKIGDNYIRTIKGVGYRLEI